MLNTIVGLLGEGAPLTDYESIATTTVGAGGAASVTFSSIPSTYTHLQIRLISRSARTDITDSILLNFNSDSGSNYSYHYLRGNGTAASSSGGASQTTMLSGISGAQTGGANIFGASVIDILDYGNTNKYKTVRTFTGEDRNGAGSVYLESGSWRNTNAVSNITLVNEFGNWSQYSSIALYGIK